jgi:predicted amidohydrolase
MTVMRVGFFQFTPRFGEVSHNLDRVVDTLGKADADLMVLPELCASGYQFVSQQEAITLSESVPDGPTTQRLIDLAKRRRMVIVAGLPERSGTTCYNSAVIVGPTGFIGCYRKTHLFFEETLFFATGYTGFEVWYIGWE